MKNMQTKRTKQQLPCFDRPVETIGYASASHKGSSIQVYEVVATVTFVNDKWLVNIDKSSPIPSKRILSTRTIDERIESAKKFIDRTI
jgi:hypothetical protein